jgi:pimeloyl-ACP methyl ester carboxylesterase
MVGSRRSWALAVVFIASLGGAAFLLAAGCRSSDPRVNAGTSVATNPPNHISIQILDSAPLSGDLYGTGERGVVLFAHGGYSSLGSWTRQAVTLANAGFRVLVVESHAAADLAAGKETACLYDEVCQARDVLAAARYLRELGAKSIALIGGSMGGGAVAQASVEARSDEVQRMVLLAPEPISTPERMKGSKLFIATRADADDAGPRLPAIEAQYARAAAPKRIVVLEGSAHAQRIFNTDQGEAVMQEILRFLTEP